MDKLKCKGNFVFNNTILFHSNQYYDYKMLSDNSYEVYTNKHKNVIFGITGTNNMNYYYHLWDYFYTKEEMRQLKIKSII